MSHLLFYARRGKDTRSNPIFSHYILQLVTLDFYNTSRESVNVNVNVNVSMCLSHVDKWIINESIKANSSRLYSSI